MGRGGGFPGMPGIPGMGGPGRKKQLAKGKAKKAKSGRSGHPGKRAQQDAAAALPRVAAEPTAAADFELPPEFKHLLPPNAR